MQYGAGPFVQQQFGTAGVKRVKRFLLKWSTASTGGLNRSHVMGTIWPADNSIEPRWGLWR